MARFFTMPVIVSDKQEATTRTIIIKRKKRAEKKNECKSCLPLTIGDYLECEGCKEVLKELRA